jgi:hypothetical protein
MAALVQPALLLSLWYVYFVKELNFQTVCYNNMQANTSKPILVNLIKDHSKETQLKFLVKIFSYSYYIL